MVGIGYIIGALALESIRLRGKPKASQSQYLRDVRELTERTNRELREISDDLMRRRDQAWGEHERK